VQSFQPQTPARIMRNRIAFSVDLFPRERIADMLRDRCSGVSQSIKVEYRLGVPSMCTFRYPSVSLLWAKASARRRRSSG
jgi:hypothetical protein